MLTGTGSLVSKQHNLGSAAGSQTGWGRFALLLALAFASITGAVMLLMWIVGGAVRPGG